jgi:formylglycine-generating enzyme required for sulfatase activity
MKRDLFYVSIFALVAVVLYGAQNIFAHFVPITSKIYLNAIQILFPFLGAIIAKYFFLKTEKRGMVKREASRLALKFYGVIVFMHLVVGGAVFFWGAMGGSTYVNLEAFMLLMPLLLVIIIAYLVLSIFQFIAIYLGVKLLGLNKNKSTKTVFEQIEGDEPSVNPATVAPATTAISEDDWKTADDDWKPVDDRGGFAIREEKAPWLKYAVGILALLLIGGGAIWLASKVVIADKVPTIERADNAKDKPIDGEAPQAPKSEDDLAWVKALEIDTVEGYRGYIADFPNGRHVEDAQRLINEFDEEAWKLADERDTIDGYEDYLESWPEGLHVTEARERIARIKAEEEARRKNAEEAARQEAAAWKTAAEANTIPSYEGYLSKFPTGKNAPEAQTRIERLRAEEARAQASAADEAAWQAANATGTADAYQQYLTSFPQGAHVPEAIAKLEDLRPGPGKTFKDCATCPTMVSLPAGTAELGAQASDGKAKPNEKPARPVTFSNLFAIGVTEVTFAEYGACVAAGGCKSMPSDNGWGQGSRPVINVSWSDAVAYAQWLSNTTGKSYALPSDAQWEYAARGGKTDALIGGSPQAICAFANGASKESGLPWANEACTDLAADRTLPVGSLSKNGFGTADMIGNVSEWTMDCNTLNLRDAPVDGSPDARGSCSQRIVRGGSWFSGPDDLRYSARAVQRRGDTNDFTGFRVVRN